MKKYLLSLFALLSIVISAQAQPTTFVVDELAYEVLSAENKTVAFSNTWYETINAQSYNTHVIDYTGIIKIPATVEYGGVSYTVTEIKKNALNKNTITELTIPATINLIPDNVLTSPTGTSGSETLKKVTIEDGEASLKINGSSGLSMSPITDWYVGRNIIDLDYSGEHAWGEEGFFGEGPEFLFQNAVNIVIGDKVTELYESNFTNATNLETVTFGNGLTTIPKCLFRNTPNLESVIIGQKVKTIEEDAFGGSGILEIEIPSNVEVIDQLAFSSCIKLKNVTFHEGLRTIGGEAFINCESLESLTIPASVESIADQAFRYCSSLTNLTILDSEKPLKLYNSLGLGYEGWPESPIADLYLGRDFDIENPILFMEVKNLTFGDGVTTITESMFAGSKVETLKLGKNITTIGERAFSNCANLKGTIEIPAKVTEIPHHTFYNCYGVTGIVLPEGLKTIGECAFTGCSSEELIIPASVTTIGSHAFGKYVYGGENEPDVKFGLVKIVESTDSIDGGQDFLGAGTIETLFVGRHMKNTYWRLSTEIGKLEIGALEELPENSFYETNIASIDLGTTLQKIGRQSFTGCKNLKQLYIPSNVQEIGEYSFTDSELVTIEAESTTPCKLGVNAFYASSYDNYSNAIVYVPSKVIDTYKTADVWKLFASIQPGWFLVSVTPNAGGTATLEGKTVKDGETTESYIKKGKDTFITLTFDEGYELGSLTVNGVEKKNDYTNDKLTFSDIQEDKEVIVNFSKIKFTVSATSGDGGTVTPASSIVEWGDDAKLTITPNEGYEINTLTVNGTEMKDKVSQGVLTISQVKQNQQVEVTFKKQIFKITINSGEGGSVTVSPDVVEWGDDAVIKVTADNNFEIASVTVDGTTVELNEDNSYTIKSVKKNITVEAAFEIHGVLITIKEIGKTTYCSEYDLDFTNVEGIKAYTATGYNDITKTIWLTRVMEVPAGTGLLVKGDVGTYKIPYANVRAYYTNMMKGNLGDPIKIEETDGDMTNYYLSGKDGSFVSVNGNANIGKNKAYLQLPTSVFAGTRTIGISYDDEDGTTGIRETKHSREDGAYYTLQGQRVQNPGKGLYIRNGCKIIVK